MPRCARFFSGRSFNGNKLCCANEFTTTKTNFFFWLLRSFPNKIDRNEGGNMQKLSNFEKILEPLIWDKVSFPNVCKETSKFLSSPIISSKQIQPVKLNYQEKQWLWVARARSKCDLGFVHHRQQCWESSDQLCSC